MNLSQHIPRHFRLGFAAIVTATMFFGACGPPSQPPFAQSAQFEARVSVLNMSREMHVLRIRELRREVQLDCELISQAPVEHLANDAFGAPARWALFSGQEIGVGPSSRNQWRGGADMNGRDCAATLIQSDTVDDIVVFWDRSLQPKLFEFDPEIPEHIKPDPQTIVLRADYEAVADSAMKPYRLRPCEEGMGCGDAAEDVAGEVPAGARYYWEDVSERKLHYERPWQPDERPQMPDAACDMPGAEASLAWEDTLTEDWEVTRLREGIDGCHTVELERERDPASPIEQVICAPFDSLQSLATTPGLSVVVNFVPHSASRSRGRHIHVRYFSDEDRFEGSVDIFLTRGQQIDADRPVGLEFETRSQCTPVEAMCGQMDVPVDVRFDNGALISPGESTSLGDGREVHVVRAFRRSVVDSSCEEDDIAQQLEGTPRPYIEAVTVARN
jgi:hypothetical protein